MYNYTVEQAVDAYNLNGESQKAWNKLKKNKYSKFGYKIEEDDNDNNSLQ